MNTRMIFCLTIALCATLFLFGCLNRCANMEKKVNQVDKPVSLHDRLEAKYHDSTREGKNACTYAMSSGLQYQPAFPELWEVINIGDSIIKDSGSLKYIIKHKEANDTEILYVQCNGRTLN